MRDVLCRSSLIAVEVETGVNPRMLYHPAVLSRIRGLALVYVSLHIQLHLVREDRSNIGESNRPNPPLFEVKSAAQLPLGTNHRRPQMPPML